MYCTQCGQKQKEDSAFCTSCGAPLSDTQPKTIPPQNYSYQPYQQACPAYPAVFPKKRRGIKTTLAIIIPLAIIICTAMVLFFTGVIQVNGPGMLSGPVIGTRDDEGFDLLRAVIVAKEKIPETGGTITVDKSGSAIDGLRLEVPEGCYAAPIDFTISEATIKASGFPKEFKILSPLIKVDNGGAFADGMMQVKIPCKLPEGYIPLGYYYDEETGTIEALPVMDYDEDSITVGLRHFSNVGAGGVSEKDAAAVESFDTGFRPGKDDFHMENNGSFLEPGGHCAGQSLATMWYYANRKLKGDNKLWNKYDNYGKDPSITFKTPNMQEDDVMALRLASVAQREADWNSTLRTKFLEACKLSDKATFYGIVFEMKLTKSPQYISIQRFDNAGNLAGGHAIIAYRAEGNRLYVADPNYPGQADRYIDFSGGKFVPYSSAATAEEAAAGKGRQYPRINLIGISAFFDHPKLAQLWQQLDNRTIGDAYFPDQHIKIYTTIQTTEGEKEEEVIEGYESQTKDLKITRVTSDNPCNVFFRVADGKGAVSERLKANESGVTSIPLTLGENYIGIEIYKMADGSPEWYDFKWIKVNLPFPFEGKWQGTIHYDKVNIPEPDPNAQTATGDTSDPTQGCEKITAEIYKMLKELEGKDYSAIMIVEPTGEKGKLEVRIGAGKTIEEAENALNNDYIVPITVNGNKAQGSLSKDQGGISLTIEADGNTADKIKGAFSFFALKDNTMGIFTTFKMDRVKEP